MKALIAAGLFTTLLMAGTAHAANPQCDAQATEKRLAGAAKTSFLKKCEADAAGATGAAATCEAQATEKKLAGAAKTSFVKKCTTDAAASAPAK